MARSRRGDRSLTDRPYAIAAAIVLVLVVAGGLWLWLGSGEDGAGPETTAGPDTAAATAPADTLAELPPPDSADPLIRELASRLSSHPRLAEWLVTENLARRFVGAVVLVGSGRSPREELGFVQRGGSFRVRAEAEGDSAVIDPASYRRYDPIVEAFASLDTEGTAEVYDRLRPLFQRIYRELGFPEGDFDVAMARAVETLQAVPVPEGPVVVVPDGAEGWAYRDPELEALSPAKKHLLRMGPENVRRVQAKLRELSEAMELPTLPVTGRRDTAS